jgi:iron complex transport system substrate-binding protein
LAARPQLVLGGGSANGAADFLERWRRLPLAALRAVPAHYIEPSSIQRQSPRVIDGIRAICEHVARIRSQQVNQGR